MGQVAEGAAELMRTPDGTEWPDWDQPTRAEKIGTGLAFLVLFGVVAYLTAHANPPPRCAPAGYLCERIQ